MLDSQQILGAIERRLVEAGEEIAALEAARAALAGSAQTTDQHAGRGVVPAV